ncbi:hypothetical protein Zm00014a_004687 [Zea mays]|uniref:Uncharacterized protein n=1 Tax=Zea mays TaxID=4577 RepID=A0A3L6FYW2_MAIZE|nr:hypothetical protein Zm00014a_004687 [Zea mays]
MEHLEGSRRVADWRGCAGSSRHDRTTRKLKDDMTCGKRALRSCLIYRKRKYIE